MKTIACGLLAVAVLAGAAVSGSAATDDCRVTGWVDSGTGGRPIFTCPTPR